RIGQKVCQNVLRMHRVAVGNRRPINRRRDRDPSPAQILSLPCTDVRNKKAKIASLASNLDLAGVKPRRVEGAFHQPDQARDGTASLRAALEYFCRREVIAPPDEPLKR